MFERYTEKARRTIFFARYEAAQFGSPFIETEHLLLGLLREDRSNFHALIGTTVPDYLQSIRKQVEANTTIRPPLSGTADLPLSNESKRVLTYAAEEAERLHHRHIGTEHLLLGLLREKNTRAAQVLAQVGLTLEAVRKRAQESPGTGRPAPTVALGAPGAVAVHGNPSYVKEKLAELRRFAWARQEWQPPDLLIEKASGKVMFYSGQRYDSGRFEFAKAAWPREHCALCRWELSHTAGPGHDVGYTNGKEWVCIKCYEAHVAPKSSADDIYT